MNITMYFCMGTRSFISVLRETCPWTPASGSSFHPPLVTSSLRPRGSTSPFTYSDQNYVCICHLPRRITCSGYLIFIEFVAITSRSNEMHEMNRQMRSDGLHKKQLTETIMDGVSKHTNNCIQHVDRMQRQRLPQSALLQTAGVEEVRTASEDTSGRLRSTRVNSDLTA
jgi:hypothetical protein